MITDIRIYVNDAWLSIIDKVENGIELQGRADEAFALGTFKAWLNINVNIASYTPLIIERDNNTIEYLMCKSRANKYLTQEDLWVHEITAMEATSVLACFILGSKNFGVTGQYKNDSYKIAILKELMEYKYPVYLNIDNSVFNMAQEFTFGKGTTLFDALVEIAKTYNRLPKVTSYSLIDSKWQYNIEFIDLSGGSEYTLNTDNLLSVAYDQDSDNYCNRLESEMDNVIDRTDIATVKGLTFRSDDIMVNEDNAILKLPTKIEEIKEVRTYVQITSNYEIRNIPIEYFDNPNNMSNDEWGTGSYSQTLLNWITQITNNGIFSMYTITSEFESRTKFAINYNVLYYAYINTLEGGTTFNLVAADGTATQNVNVALANFTLPKAQYDALEAQEQPYHTYYETGSNIIDGFYRSYKDDFWNIILGEGKLIKLKDAVLNNTNVVNYPKSYTLNGITMLNNDGFTYPTILFEAMFDIDYIPIVDMFMSSNKNVTPHNELAFKDYSRTYNIGANFIDFDRAVKSIQKTNDMLGLNELTLEIMTNNAPYATQYIMYDNIKWYVASVVRYINITNEYCMVNLVRDYNKVAEAIGVQTQYSETKNPLENIIDRHIFVESNVAVTINPDKLYFNIQMQNNLYKKATVSHEGNVVYLVCEADDQYNFDSQIEPANSSNNKIYKQIQVPYVNSYNEYAKATISLVEINSLNAEQSHQMPIYTGNRTQILGLGTRPVYKDAKERLIFTIKLNNATIVDN